MADGRAYLAKLKGSRRGFTVVDFHDVSIGRGAEAADNLGKLLERCQALGRPVHLAVDSASALVRRVTLPISNPRQIEKTARFQVEALSPATALEDLAVGHHVVERHEGTSDVLLFAVERTRVQQGADLVCAAGAQAAGVTLDTVALFNLARASGKLPQGEGAVVDQTGGIVRIVLTSKGRMVLARAWKAGDSALLAERVVEEIKRSLVVAGGSGKVQRVVVVGASSGALYGRLQSGLGAETVLLDPLSRLERFQSQAPPAEGLFAVGAALGGLGTEGVNVDFLRDGGARALEMGGLRKHLLYMAVALCALFGFLAARSWTQAEAEEGELKSIVAREKEVYENVRKTLSIKKPYRRQSWDRTLEAAVKKASKNTQTKATTYVSFLSRWRLLARALDGADATVLNIVFNQQKTVVSGIIPDIDRFEALVRAFRREFGDRVSDKFERRGKRDRKRSQFTIEIPNQ